jgi:hypothetical protein
MSVFDPLDTATPTAGGSPSESPSDFAAVRQRIFGTKNKSSKTKRSDSAAETIEADELAKIFAGENWEEVASLYFNARFAITGWDGFELTTSQKKTLGISLASTMKMLLKIDPGYIALLVFTANFGGLIAQKEMSYRSILKEDQRMHPEKYDKKAG